MDRAALDVAAALGLDHGGWCPAGRRSEVGPIPARYNLKETPDTDYEQRTEWNVRDSDATLIIGKSRPLTGGTELTRRFAEQYGRPFTVVDVFSDASAEVRAWIAQLKGTSLNIAGPRESEIPGVYDAAKRFLEVVLKQ